MAWRPAVFRGEAVVWAEVTDEGKLLVGAKGLVRMVYQPGEQVYTGHVSRLKVLEEGPVVEYDMTQPLPDDDEEDGWEDEDEEPVRRSTPSTPGDHYGAIVTIVATLAITYFVFGGIGLCLGRW